MTRRLQLKAMGEALKAFAESNIGRELRETLRRFSESDIAKKLREAAKSFPTVDPAVIAGAAKVKEALTGMLEAEDEVLPARPRRRGGRHAIHDWVGAKQRAADEIKVNGRPKVRQRLVEVVRGYLGDTAPDDREIRRVVVDSFYPQKQKVGKLPPKVGKLPR
jgi:hypothetical protein